MTRLAKLQLIGPIVLFGVVLAAESAAWALSKMPSSEFLWYLNLTWFRAFQWSHYILNDYFTISYVQLVVVAVPLLTIAIIGWALRGRLLVAVASNLSFVYAAFLAYNGFSAAGIAKSASLSLVNIPAGPDFYLISVLLGASLMSFVISHVVYLQWLRAQAAQA